MRRVFPRILIQSALTAFALQCGLPAQAQMRKGCSATNHVGSDSNNPFTAEYVSTSTKPTSAGAQKIMGLKVSVARDSRGRIRFESHGVAQSPIDRKTVTLETPDGKQFTVTGEELRTVIDIYDCASGTSTRIRPGMRIVTVEKDESPAPLSQPRRTFSSLFIPPPGAKTPANVTHEQLGTRIIQGISALGVKTTTLGTEEDGDWNGKPISEREVWDSDELAVQVLAITRDFRTGSEGRTELTAINRNEPDPALFEIPKDYDLNPARLPSAKD